MDIRYLSQDEKNKSRQLYEASFFEDSEEFVDYYYSEKCRDNQILVMEDYDRIVSMIHLNPFTVSLYGQPVNVNYVVAVATDEDFRMQGYMRQLMEKVFHDMYEAEMPFTFLTPANPDYYYSCGFEYWESQIQLHQDQDTIWKDGQCIDVAMESDCAELAAFSNETLAGQFDLFIKKDEAYYKRLIKEQECDGGHVLLIKEKNEMLNEKNHRVGGIFCMNHGMGLYIREPIMAHSCREEVQAKMMGRIINLEQFFSMLKSEEPIMLEVRVRDTMIPENEGSYCVSVNKDGGQAKQIFGYEPEKSMDIAELGQFFFNKMRIYINEVV